MRKGLLCALVLTAGWSVAACDIRTENGDFDIDFASGKATDTWSRTYTVEAGGRFELINVNGRITAEPAEGRQVVVEARRTAKARSEEAARDMLGRLEIREEVGGSSVRVESRPPRFSGFGGHEIEWTVKVPKGLVVDLRTVNGGVRLNGLAGEVYARTTNGGVKGSNLAIDKLEASVVNGGIDIELGSPLDAADAVDLSSVNGGVTLTLPGESKATIAARAVNGGVRVSDDLHASAEDEGLEFERRRRFNGTINGGGARVSAATTNGGVRILKAGSPTT